MLSDLVVAYLFLGGAGAGTCFVVSVLALFSPRFAVRDAACALCYGKLYVASYSIGCACLLVGSACLAFDLGRFDALVTLVASPRPSFIAIGSYAILVCCVLAFALALLWLRIGWRGVPIARLRVATAAHVACAFTAVCVMAYTGLLLQSIGSVPLWNSPFVPVLLVASSASCGCALVIFSAHVTDVWRPFAKTLFAISKCDAALIAIEAVCLVLFVTGFLRVDTTNQTLVALRESACDLVFGDFSLAFWIGLVVVGLVAPLVFDVLWAKSSRSPRFALAACACVLVGGLVLRTCLVGAGMHPEISTL